jgi:Protein of unknown function (DUF3501)
MNRKLTLNDIAEPRAYERQRPEFRDRIIALKTRRRVHVGTILSVVFENRDTMLFQVQEMARAEKMTTDVQIEHELATYNPLIPDVGDLSATLFIECTDDEQMKYWFPRLVGIERSIEIEVGQGTEAIVVRCQVEAAHEAQLTREDTTSAVHYIRWTFPADAVAAFVAGPVTLRCTHPNYLEAAELTIDTRTELFSDLR